MMYRNEGEWRLVVPSFEKTWVTLSITSLIIGGNWIFYSIYISKFNVYPSLKIALIEHQL